MTNTKKRVYEDGINFTCLRSGNCCKIIDGWVEMTGAELKLAANLLNISRDEFEQRYVKKKLDEEYYLKQLMIGYVSKKDFDQALEIVSVMVQKYNTIENYEIIASVYYAKSDYQNAIKYYESAYIKNQNQTDERRRSIFMEISRYNY